MIRLLAGFLFAIVIIVVGHFGAWMFAAKHAEKQFVQTLEAMPNVTLSYDTIAQRGYPKEVELVIENMTLTWLDAEKENGATVKIPEVKIQSPLFDMRKALVKLNRNFDIELQHGQGNIRHFRVSSEGAQFSSFIRPDNTTEHAFNMANLTLWDTSSQANSDQPVLRTGVGYLVREVPGVRAPVAWRISLQQAQATEHFLGQPFELNRLVAVFGLDTDFLSGHGSNILLALSSKNAHRKEAKTKLAEQLAETSFEPHILINSMQIEKDDDWVSLRGAFGLNREKYLDGRLSLNANNLEQVLSFMRNTGILDIPTTNRTVFKSSNKDNTQPSKMSIIFERDRAYINNEFMTTAPTIQELLSQE